MPRPTSNQVARVQLDTNQGNPGGLGVFQSLDVRAPAPKSAQLAQGLADVLGVAIPMANDAIERRSETETSGGIRDASFGKIDDERLKRGLAYRTGVEHVEVKKALYGAQAEWQESYGQMDKTLPADEVARRFDGFMKERLGEIAQRDPKLAAKMAPTFLHSMQELVVSHQAQLTKQHIVEAELVMQQGIADSLTRGVPVDFASEVTPLFQLTGDFEAAVNAGIEAVGQKAVELGRPDLIKQLPTTIALGSGESIVNGDFSPAQRLRIEEFRKAADAKWVQNHHVERTVAKSGIEKNWLDLLGSGQIVPWEQLEAQMKVPLEEHPLFTQDELMLYYRQNLAAQQAQDDSLMFGGLDNTRPYYMQQGMLDANGKVITKERIQNQTNREVEAVMQQIIQSSGGEVPAEVAMAIAAKSVTATHAYPYEPLKSTLENAPLDQPQVFANAANAYSELPVTQRAKYVTDPKRRADFETFLSRRDSVGAQRAVEEIATADPDLVEKNLQANRPAIRKAAEDIGSMRLSGKNWSPLGGDDVFVSDLVDSGYALRTIEQGIELRVGRHNMSPEAAREAATQDFMSTHMILETQRGYRALPRVPGTTDVLGEAVDWIERVLPSVGKQKSVEVPEGSYLVLDPTTRDNAVFVVRGPTGEVIAPGVLRFPAQNIERKFRETNPTGDWKQRQIESAKETRRRQLLDEQFAKPNPLMFNTRD
jgi:hypothetical protein